MKYLLLVLTMVFSISAQFFLKKGIDSSSLSNNFISLIKTIFSPLVFTGFVLYGLSALTWLFVLQKLSLSTAYPSLALTYVAILFIGFLFFNEPITTLKVIGIICICFGVILINR